jgi:peptidyl-prolyl cis-trans isomerase SurA
MRKFFPGLLLLCLLGLPGLAANTVIEEIIARVNNRIITRSDFLRSEEELKQEVQQQDPVNADKLLNERKPNILRDLIDQQLLLDKGVDLGMTGDTELIKWLDDMRKQMKLDTMEDLEKAAQAQGVSFEEFKQNKRNQIITQQVISKEVGSRLNITPEEEKQFYEEHKNELQRPEQVRLSEILLAPKKKDSAAADDDPEALAAAKAKAEDLLSQIRKGASFEDVAKKSSDGPSAAQGGDLGEFQRGTLAKQIEDATFSMKPGEVSDVIHTKQGFVILKVTEHQSAGIPTMKEIEPRIQEAVYMQKLQPALRAYLERLREDAFIDIPKPGYVDTAASPNETKPVETAAADPKAKKLAKKKKRMLLF